MSVKKSAVVIDTSLNTQKIDADFKKIDKHTKSLINRYNKSVDSIRSQELAIEKVEQKIEDIKSGNLVPTSLRELNTQLKQSQNELDKVNNKIQKLSIKRRKSSSDENELKKLQQSRVNLNQIISEINYELSEQRESSVELKQLNKQLDNMNSKLSQTNEEANQIKDEYQKIIKQRRNLLGFSDGIEDIGKKIDKFKTKMSRLIGTAMIFSLMKNQISSLQGKFISLLKTDDTFSNSLNQIKANLMTAFAPIYNACLPAINTLMNALSKLTGTITVFVSGLFGKSLSDSTKEAKKLSDALEDTSKSGEEASGSLASFDKLEVIGDNNQGGGSSSNSNSIDYNGEIEYSARLLEFLNNIKSFVAENKDGIIAFLWGVAGGIAAIKLGCDGFKALGIGLLITGIVLLIQDVIKFLNDPTFENFGKILTDIGIILFGLAIIIGSIPLAVAAAITLIVGLIITNWDKIKEILGQVGLWIFDNVIKPVGKFFKAGFDTIVSDVKFWLSILNGLFTMIIGIITSPFRVAVDTVKEVFNNLKNAISYIVSGIGKLFTGDLKGALNDFKMAFKSVFGALWSIAKSPINLIIDGINSLIKGINKISFDVPDWVPKIGGKTLGFNIPKIPKLAQGTVIPPRQEFMAILGDQKHGTNIEAPLETIKQANREVMQEFLSSLNGLNNSEREIVLRNLTFVLNLGNSNFQKFIIEALRLSEKETGKQLLVN